jgi:glyoxylase-like metal-dependent hydrolase (beta-lactamase superfamily II)
VRVHHLNCSTLCPASAALINDGGRLFERGRMVCHCLLIEGEDGLVLVDTGIGTQDMADLEGRLGAVFARVVAPRCDVAETALSRVKALGFSPSDVRHIVPTHLDLDHAGGLPDFPRATVHIFEPEHAAAMARRTRQEQERYRPVHWAHGPSWKLYSTGGDRWLGFDSVRAITGSPEILIIPLQGHTRGHAGVAVRTESGWLLHAGDAYFHHGEMDAERPHCTPGLRLFQRLAAMDDSRRRRNQARLRDLARREPSVRVFSAHCPVEYDTIAARSADA